MDVRRAILALGHASGWSRSEIRAMTPDEFAAYLEGAGELGK